MSALPQLTAIQYIHVLSPIANNIVNSGRMDFSKYYYCPLLDYNHLSNNYSDVVSDLLSEKE